jgi:hypothetical protein
MPVTRTAKKPFAENAMNFRSILFVLFLPCVSPVAAQDSGDDCPLGVLDKVTDDFYFTASSAQGAVGDIVAIDIGIVVEHVHGDFVSISAVGCFDNTKAELVGSPQHSGFFDRVAFMSEYYTLPQGIENPQGFRLSGVIRDSELGGAFPSTDPVPLATLFFRVRGEPGEALSVDFCDFRSASGCIRPKIYYSTDTERRSLNALSTRHVPGEIRILPGEPTNTEPPPLPPPVKVYDEEPTRDAAEIRFELTGAVVQPETRGVPLDLFITSNHEWSGFAVSLRFPGDLAKLVRVDEHIRPGALRIDNEEGGLGIVLTNSRRRIGAEGERVLVATLHFDIQPGAEDIGEISPAFAPFGPYLNWLEIFYRGTVAEETVVSAEVEPLFVAPGLLKIQTRPTGPGDVNVDYALDLADAMAILGDLFLGTDDVLCAEAADFDGDGKVDISDPIGILGHLFLGDPGPPAAEILCGKDGI